MASTTSPPRPPPPLHSPGRELIGRCVLVERARVNAAWCMQNARVLGYRDGVHLLYYDDHSREVADLRRRQWCHAGGRREFLVGRRIAVFWDDGLDPLEAFVIGRAGVANRYRVVYTKCEHLEDMDMAAPQNRWVLLGDDVYVARGRRVNATAVRAHRKLPDAAVATSMRTPSSTPKQKQDLCGTLLRLRDAVQPMLVVGYSRGMHKLYNVQDQATEVVSELRGDEYAVCSHELVFPVGQRVLVFWDGAYTADAVLRKLPYEAYVVQHCRETTFRLLYTADDTLEDRDLNQARVDSDELHGWRLVNGDVWDVNEQPVVTWSERPPLIQPVVDYASL